MSAAENLSGKLKEVISLVLEVPLESISEDSKQGDPSVWDSLHHMNVVMAVEEEFNVRFSDEEVVKMKGFRDILASLESRLGR